MSQPPETTHLETPEPPWHRHPVSVCTLIGMFIGVFAYQSPPPGEEDFFLGPGIVVITGAMGFSIGLVKAVLDGLPIGRFLVAWLLAELFALLTLISAT